MILEHMETGLRVRVVQEKDEQTVIDGYGKTTKVVVQSRLVTDGGQPVRACREPTGRFFQVGTSHSVLNMMRVDE